MTFFVNYKNSKKFSLLLIIKGLYTFIILIKTFVVFANLKRIIYWMLNGIRIQITI